MSTSTEGRRWQEVKALLAQLLEQPVGERQGLAARLSAGDAALHAELVSLLAAAEATGPMAPLSPALALQALHSRLVVPPHAGRRIGPWRIGSLIARGGMGEVYRAERADGQFEQQVAIKLLRSGLNPDWLVSRFAAERQILASLDHPNLARLLDGGTTEDGQPYFVMELVEGEPIDRHCLRLGLPVRARLALFRTVCQVVGYAHSKGVVHRDLKCDNILVTAQGVVKLVDFGIAKEWAAPTQQTVTAQRLMTLACSSPEQVRGDAVTPASDVYSLGVVLYRLLTQTSPYGGVTADSGYDLARAICDTEPPPPSRAPATEPALTRALRRRLRGDLDAVVLMALRKNPQHRYRDAHELGEDVFRHLESMPVRARRGAWSYRAQRFVLRHRLVVGAAMLANIALAAGLGMAVYAGIEAHRQRERAEQHFASVRKLANVFLFEVDDAIRNLAGATQARQLVVKRGLEYLQQIAPEHQGDPALRLEIGAGYRKIAEIQGRPYVANLGDPVGARANFKRAREALQPVVDGLPGTDGHHQSALLALSIVDEFEADLLVANGSPAALQEARTLLHTVRERDAALGALRPGDRFADYRTALAAARESDVLMATGDFSGFVQASDESLRLLESTRRRLPQDTDVAHALASVLNQRGLAFMARDDDRASTLQALAELQRSVSVWQELQRAEPANAFYGRNVATGRINTGEALLKIGHLEQAEAEFRPAIDAVVAMARADPMDPELLLYRAIGQIGLAGVWAGQHRQEVARTELRDAIARVGTLPESLRSQVATQAYLARAHYALGMALEPAGAKRAAGRQPACRAYRQALDILLPLHRASAIAPGTLQPQTVQAAAAGCG